MTAKRVWEGAASLSRLAVPIKSLTPYPVNPNHGDVGAISESLRIHGQYKPIVVNKGDDPGWSGDPATVLAGNHTMFAADSLGWTHIARTLVDVDDDTGARIVLMDNRASDLSSYDDYKLADMLTGLAASGKMLEGTGFDGDYLDDLSRQLASYGGSMDPAGEWAGMPGYSQENLQGAAKVTVHFLTHDDADAFFKLIDRERRSYMWWPAGDGHVGMDTDLAVISDGEQSEYYVADGNDIDVG